MSLAQTISKTTRSRNFEVGTFLVFKWTKLGKFHARFLHLLDHPFEHRPACSLDTNAPLVRHIDEETSIKKRVLRLSMRHTETAFKASVRQSFAMAA